MLAKRKEAARREARKPLNRAARVEGLEHRLLLTAAPLTSDTVTAAEVLTPTAPPIAQPLDDSIPLAISVYRKGAPVAEYAPATDDDIARGNLLRSVLAAAAPGDVVQLAAATFDMGGLEHVEFPDQVTVRGAGKADTRITSSVPQSVDGASTYELNDGSVVEDLWLEGSLHNGSYQPLVGTQLPHTADTTAYLRRVKITGDSDGIFVWGNSIYQYTIYAYDCDITTNYDAVAILGTDLNRTLVELYNCSLTVSQPDSIPAHTSNAVNDRSGTVGLYNCTINATGDANSLQTVGVYTYNHGTSIISNCTFNVSAPTGLTYDLYIRDNMQSFVIGGTGSGAGGSYVSSSGTEIDVQQVPSTVAGRQVFYNNSNYDGNDPESNPADAGAIATDKTALLPGAVATFANVTSYSRGINGVMIDLSGIHGNITADDFSFKVGNNNAPATWQQAPAPKSVTVWNDVDSGGTDRVELIWDDGAIANQWLEVSMLANADTGLSAADTFYFGNLVGDSGLGDSGPFASVSVTDSLAVRNNPANYFEGIPPLNAFDYNRDGKVSSTDELLARNNFTNLGTALRLIDLSATTEQTPSAVAVDAVAASWAVVAAAQQLPSETPPTPSAVDLLLTLDSEADAAPIMAGVPIELIASQFAPIKLSAADHADLPTHSPDRDGF